MKQAAITILDIDKSRRTRTSEENHFVWDLDEFGHKFIETGKQIMPRMATKNVFLWVLTCLFGSSAGVNEYDFLQTEKSKRDHADTRALTVDTIRENDLCRNYNGVLVECNLDRFPVCETGIELCLERVPLNSVQYLDKWKLLEDEKYFKHKEYYDENKEHILFVIDYRKVQCAPSVDWNCKRCAKSALFCRKEGFCMEKKQWKASCLDKSNTRASELRREIALGKKEKRKQQREKRKEQRKKNRHIQRKQGAAGIETEFGESEEDEDTQVQPDGE